MTSMMHRFGDDPFQRQLQLSELALVTSSQNAARNLAENYTGFPFDETFGGG
jgi:p-hydroxybenzoate 3-monooxygenase